MPAPTKLTTGPNIGQDAAAGSLYGDNGAFTSDGAGNLTLTSIALAEGTTTPQALATGTAIILIPAGQSVVRVSAGAATTGATLPVGTRNGQLLTLIVTSAIANTITFAAAGTSFVSGGAAVSIAGLAAHLFVWDATSALWFQVGPAVN